MHIDSSFPTLLEEHADNVRNASFDVLQKHYRIVISINGSEPVTCPFITANRPIWIAECGQCGCDDADAILRVSSNQELVVEKIGHAEVMLTRAGRNCHLNPGKPISIFKNDVITTGNSSIQIVEESLITRRIATNTSYIRLFYSRNRTYRRILSTIAAIFTLINVYSTAYGQTPDNDCDAPQLSEPSNNNTWYSSMLKRFKAKAHQPTDSKTSENNHAKDNDSCEEGKTLCLANLRYLCKNHRWLFMEMCKKPAYCDANYSTCQGGEPCQNGHYACYDDEMYKCENSKWTFQKQCELPSSCILESETEAKCIRLERTMGKPSIGKECTGSEMKCDSNAIMRCRFGRWQYTDVCNKSEMCEKISDVEAKCVRKRGTIGRISSPPNALLVY